MKEIFHLVYGKKFFELSKKAELLKSFEIFEFALVNIAGFLIPLTLGHPQLIVGSVVNALIFYSALRFDKQKILPVIFLPSIAVLTRGLIFGPLTYFLLILAPFIWASNAIQVFASRYFLLKKFKLSYSLILSILLKAGFLFVVTFALVSLAGLPKIFLLAMGPVQVLTGVAGVLLIMGVRLGLEQTGLLKNFTEKQEPYCS